MPTTLSGRFIGHRGAKDKPVTLVISVDGKPVKTVEVPVQISAVNQQGGATQRSYQEEQVFLTGGEHSFRAEFVNDEGLKDIPEEARFNNNKQHLPGHHRNRRAVPFRRRPSRHRRQVLICDPASGPACVEKIVTSLAHRAYRRPVTKQEVAELMAGLHAGEHRRATHPRRACSSPSTAMLVSPQFLFRMRTRPQTGHGRRASPMSNSPRG